MSVLINSVTDATTQDERPDIEAGQTKTGIYSWYVLMLLTIAYGFASIDRFALNIVFEPMRRDLNATDAEMGMISASFIIFYSFFGIPIARWVDRGDRRRIMALSLAVWSLMTMLTGISASVLQAGLSRIGLGISEAGGMPSSLSIISDLFSRQRRALAVSIFQSGMAGSALIGSPIVGMIAHHYGWRGAFIALACPGFVIALVMLFTVREPQRQAAKQPMINPTRPSQRESTLGKDTRRLFADRRFWLLFVSQLFIGLPTGSLPVWYTVLLMRAHGIDVSAVAWIAALLFGAIMIVAYLVSGIVVTKVVTRTGQHRHGALLPGIVCLVSAPFGLAMLLPGSLTTSLAFACAFFFFMFMSRPAGAALALDFAPPELRGLATAIIVIATSVLGNGLAPVIVGSLSDFFSVSLGKADALRSALLMFTPVEVVLSGIAFIALSRAMAVRRE